MYPTGNTAEQVYNGEQFPEYHWRDDVATVTLEYGEYPRGVKYEYLYLPCWEVEIEKAVNRLGLKSAHAYRTDLDFKGMSEELYQLFTEEYRLIEHLHTLNSLARSYIGFDEQSRTAFHAVVEMAQPQTPEDAALLAENFYEFTAVPGIKTPAEYGRYMTIDSSCYELDEDLEEYIDFKSYGEHRVQKERQLHTIRLHRLLGTYPRRGGATHPKGFSEHGDGWHAAIKIARLANFSHTHCKPGTMNRFVG